jgi:hypothetical protein
VGRSCKRLGQDNNKLKPNKSVHTHVPTDSETASPTPFSDQLLWPLPPHYHSAISPSGISISRIVPDVLAICWFDHFFGSLQRVLHLRLLSSQTLCVELSADGVLRRSVPTPTPQSIDRRGRRRQQRF